MEYTTIGEACSLHARIGWQGLTKSEYLDEGDYYLVTGVDFDNGHIAFDTCHFVTKERYDQDQHIQLRLNDVLVTKDGTIGKVAFIDRPLDKPATLNSGVFVVRPKNPDLLLPEYLMIMLMSKHFSRFIEQIKVGCTIAHLNQEKFLRYQFPLPPVTEQEHIIEVYYSATDIIEKRQRQLRTFDNLIKARFVEMFGDPEYNEKGWPIKKLNDLCNVGSSKRIYQEEQTMEGVPFWRISDLVSKMDTGDVESSLFIPENRYEELKEQSLVPEPGDILVTSRGTLGRCYIVAPNDRFYFQDGMISWLSQYEDAIMPLYIQFLFDMPGFRKQIDGMQAGSTVAYLSIAMLKKLDIMLPGRDVQEQFATFVSQVDKSKVVVQQALDKAQLLFDSLMQQYFG